MTKAIIMARTHAMLSWLHCSDSLSYGVSILDTLQILQSIKHGILGYPFLTPVHLANKTPRNKRYLFTQSYQITQPAEVISND